MEVKQEGIQHLIMLSGFVVASLVLLVSPYTIMSLGIWSPGVSELLAWDLVADLQLGFTVLIEIDHLFIEYSYHDNNRGINVISHWEW